MRFRFIHAADIHLDSPLRGLSSLNLEDDLGDQFRGATRKAFVNLIDFALEEKVDFVVLAGDLYDGDWKDYSTGLFFHKQIARLGKIMVYVVAGNHDAANKMTKKLTPPQNMKLFSHKKPQTFLLEEHKVALHGQSYPERSVTDNLALKYPAAKRDYFNIGLLHTSLDGREGHANYAPCSLDDLCTKGYDYWALGHVHTREVVRPSDPAVVFSGCLQGRHIREEGAKGATLVTVEDENIMALEPKHFDVLRWFLCRIDLSGSVSPEDLFERLDHGISLTEKADGRPVMVRIELVGESTLAAQLLSHAERWEAEIRSRLEEMSSHLGLSIWVEKIKNETSMPQQQITSAAYDDALSHLLKAVQSPEYNVDAIPGLQEKITELRGKLRKKLPRSFYIPNASNMESMSIDDESHIADMVIKGKKMLKAVLLEKENSLED
ncbi:MAG: DNA repair exonuclease [Proteobacteria bacterium]|nr:DNA repair exonuclease [Pseudomonadota bacterium]